MSPATSASPIPGSAGKGLAASNAGMQSNSSLQQLEQMVMPGVKDGQMLPQGNPALQQQQQQPPTKTPKSPSVRGGHSTPLSPQQWPQQQQQQQPTSRPRSQSGKDQQSANLPPPGAAKGMGPQGMMHMAPNGPGGLPMSSLPGMHPGMMDQQQAMMGHPGMHPGMYMGPGAQQGMRMMSPHPGMQQQQQHPMAGARTPMGPQVPGANPQMLQQQGYHNMPSHMMGANQYGGQPQQQLQQQQNANMPPGMMNQQKVSLQQQQQQQQQHMSAQQQQQGYEQVKLAEQKMARGVTEQTAYQAQQPVSGLPTTTLPKDDSTKDISSSDISAKETEGEKKSSAVPMTEMSAPQPDRDTLVVTPKLDEGEYKSDYPDDPQTESVTSKCDQVTMTDHFYFLNFQIQSLFLIRWHHMAFYFLLFAYINILQSLLIIFEQWTQN